MGSFVFRWPYPADDVHVTGTFDDWGKTEQMYKVGDHWEKEVDLPSADEKVWYKFVVDGEWILDENAPKEDDHHNNLNNVLRPEQITRKPKAAKTTDDVPGAFPETPANEAPSSSSNIAYSTMHSKATYLDAPSSAAAKSEQDQTMSVQPIPASSGVGNPVSVPAGSELPDQKDVSSNTIGSTVTTSQEDYEKAGSAPEAPGDQTVSIDPIPASSGTGNPVNVAPGAPLPDQKEVTSNTIGSTVTTSQEDYEKAGSAPEAPGDQTVSVNPIPASSGIGNPINVAPGASLPDQKEVSPNTVDSTATTSKEDYEKAGSSSFPSVAAIGAAGVGAVTAGGAALASVFSKPEGKKDIIPESSLPMDAPKTDNLDAGPFISSSGPGTTTAELASKVPLEPPTDPTIQSSGPGTTTADLASKVPLEPAATADPTIQSSGPETTTAGLAAGVPLEKKRQAMIIDPSDAPSTVPDVVKESMSAAHESPEAASSPIAVDEKAAMEQELKSKTVISEAIGAPASSAAQQSSYYGLATSVPETVEKSMEKAHASPEAAVDPAAVNEKSAVEDELLAKIPSTDAAGEPAPSIAAATSATAPAASSTTATATSLTDGKTANETVPDTDTSTATHGATAGEIAGGAVVGGAAAASAAAVAAQHKDADVEPARVPDSTKPDITTEASPAAVTDTTAQVPGQHPTAAAAIADGAAGTPTTEVPKTLAPVEKSEAATTEYAPVRSAGATPGVSSAAAAALSDGTEDPTLLEEPAVQMMNQNEAAGKSSIPVAAATNGNTGASTTTGAAATTSGKSLTPAEGVPSLTSAGTVAPKAEEKKKSSGLATTGTAPTETKSSTAPSTPAKKTTAASGSASGSGSPATTTTAEKKKKHRISGFFKKVFHQS